MKVLGVTGAVGLTGFTGAAGAQDQSDQSSQNSDEDHYFEKHPEVEIPVIDGYHDGEKVWFIHTSASTEKMAERLTEMIDYPPLHVPKLDEIDALAEIYVFKNGIDRSDAEPWGGGPFGYQIDLLDSVPDDQAYTPLRHPHLVSWCDDADPRILTSVDELMAARDAGELDIMPTDVVVTAPVVSWPGDPFVDYPEANGNSG
ncbi:MAG: hypothetical protein ABEI98_09565 [Halorhabdus sp.]